MANLPEIIAPLYSVFQLNVIEMPFRYISTAYYGSNIFVSQYFGYLHVSEIYEVPNYQR